MSGNRERRPRRANGANVTQLRRKIDQGRFRDKVAGSDPTVTPLGTDDEAAGVPARAEEAAPTPATPDRTLHGIRRGPASTGARPVPMVAYAAPVVAVILAAVVAWLAL